MIFWSIFWQTAILCWMKILHWNICVSRDYSTTKIDDIVVNVGNTEYKANTTDGHSFSIEMSKRTRANTYTADVYAGGTMIATGLEFKVEKEGFKSNDIL